MKLTTLLLLGVLLLAVSGVGETALVSLPTDSTGAVGEEVVLPLDIDDASGVLAANLRIEYDPAVLNATNVNKTPLTEDFDLFKNLSNPGVILFVLFGTEPLIGGGPLVNIRFNVVGAGVTVLPIVECLLEGLDEAGNEIRIPCTTQNGRFITEGVVPVNPFLCYKARSTTAFRPIRDVMLADQFGTETVDVKKPAALCNPADKQGEGLIDPNTHLKGYKIKQKALHEPVTGIIVKNQLHPDGLSVDTITPDRLLVPTAKSLTGEVDAPDPASHNVDHYKCYKVRLSEGQAFNKIRGVEVKDQFIEAQTGGQPKLFDLRKPTRLCLPVLDKEHPPGTHTLGKNPDIHLMCYQVKGARGEPKHTPLTGVHVNNQFGPEQLDTIKEEELCVPSEKIID